MQKEVWSDYEQEEKMKMIDIRIATKDDIDCLMSIRLEMLTVVNNLPENYEHSDEFIKFNFVISSHISSLSFLEFISIL